MPQTTITTPGFESGSVEGTARAGGFAKAAGAMAKIMNAIGMKRNVGGMSALLSSGPRRHPAFGGFGLLLGNAAGEFQDNYGKKQKQAGQRFEAQGMYLLGTPRKPHRGARHREQAEA